MPHLSRALTIHKSSKTSMFSAQPAPYILYIRYHLAIFPSPIFLTLLQYSPCRVFHLLDRISYVSSTISLVYCTIPSSHTPIRSPRSRRRSPSIYLSLMDCLLALSGYDLSPLFLLHSRVILSYPSLYMLFCSLHSRSQPRIQCRACCTGNSPGAVTSTYASDYRQRVLFDCFLFAKTVFVSVGLWFTLRVPSV